jgi:hypothetical protein
VAAHNRRVLAELPFSDRQDLADAMRGFVGTATDTTAPDRYAFLTGEAPDTGVEGANEAVRERAAISLTVIVGILMRSCQLAARLLTNHCATTGDLRPPVTAQQRTPPRVGTVGKRTCPIHKNLRFLHTRALCEPTSISTTR